MSAFASLCSTHHALSRAFATCRQRCATVARQTLVGSTPSIHAARSSAVQQLGGTHTFNSSLPRATRVLARPSSSSHALWQFVPSPRHRAADPVGDRMGDSTLICPYDDDRGSIQADPAWRLPCPRSAVPEPAGLPGRLHPQQQECRTLAEQIRIPRGFRRQRTAGVPRRCASVRPHCCRRTAASAILTTVDCSPVMQICHRRGLPVPHVPQAPGGLPERHQAASSAEYDASQVCAPLQDGPGARAWS